MVFALKRCVDFYAKMGKLIEAEELQEAEILSRHILDPKSYLAIVSTDEFARCYFLRAKFTGQPLLEKALQLADGNAKYAASSNYARLKRILAEFMCSCGDYNAETLLRQY
jgi:hypothetical protein